MAQRHCSSEGADYEKAAAKLKTVLERKATKAEQNEARYIQRQGEGWFLLGEARRRLRDPEAGKAYLTCIGYPTNYAYRARYYLALAAVANGQLDGALGMLEQNLTLLHNDPDPEAQEMSLYALGDLLYRRGNYHMVVQRLGAAVKHFPANPEATALITNWPIPTASWPTSATLTPSWTAMAARAKTRANMLWTNTSST